MVDFAEVSEESQIFVSESSFYRILHERGLLERMEHDFVLAADEFHHKTKFANECTLSNKSAQLQM